MTRPVAVHWADRAGRTVCRPAFVAAVAVLLVNDHVLKGAAGVPGGITGKLSDVAGLFFFPVLLAVVATAVVRPARCSRVRRISVAATVATMGVFAAVNLSPALAATLTEVWGHWTADPTDLACLPFALAGHLWFVRQVTVDATADPGRLLRYAMLLVAAGASIATSKPTPSPDAELRNEMHPSLGFVETDARIIYHASSDPPSKPIFRQRVDGTQKTELTGRDHAVESSSHRGDALLLWSSGGWWRSEGLYLYRDGQSELERLLQVDGFAHGPLLSPDSDWIAIPVDPEDATRIQRIELYDIGSGTREVIREDVDAASVDLGWSRDGSALYLGGNGNPARYDLDSETWTALEDGEIAWDELHRAEDPTPHRCRDDSGLWRLQDPAREGNFDGYEGLELIEPEGDAEVLVEIEITQKMENPDKFESPLDHFQFVGDCKHVVFTMDDDDAIRVVEADSKSIGTVANGDRGSLLVIPEDRP